MREIGIKMHEVCWIDILWCIFLVADSCIRNAKCDKSLLNHALQFELMITLQETPRLWSVHFFSPGLFTFSSDPRSYPTWTMYAPCIMSEKNDTMCVSMSYVWNACISPQCVRVESFGTQGTLPRHWSDDHELLNQVPAVAVKLCGSVDCCYKVLWGYWLPVTSPPQCVMECFSF